MATLIYAAPPTVRLSDLSPLTFGDTSADIYRLVKDGHVTTISEWLNRGWHEIATFQEYDRARRWLMIMVGPEAQIIPLLK